MQEGPEIRLRFAAALSSAAVCSATRAAASSAASVGSPSSPIRRFGHRPQTPHAMHRTKSGGSETPEKAGTHTIPLTYDPWTEYEFVGCRVSDLVSRPCPPVRHPVRPVFLNGTVCLVSCQTGPGPPDWPGTQSQTRHACRTPGRQTSKYEHVITRKSKFNQNRRSYKLP